MRRRYDENAPYGPRNPDYEYDRMRERRDEDDTRQQQEHEQQRAEEQPHH